MDEPYILDHRVREMMRVAIRRARRLFEEFPDIDDESLEGDMWVEIVKARYDPTQSQAHVFAYRVCWCRLRDIAESRSLERKRQQEGREMGEYRRGEVQRDETVEEAAARIYAAVKARFEASGLPVRPRHCGASYMDRVQRLSLHALQENRGWSTRQAERELGGHPAALAALGVAHPPDHTFFSRTRTAVAQLTKIFSRRPAPQRAA